MHCTRSRSKTYLVYWHSRHLCLIDWRGLDPAVGVVVCKASVLNWLYTGIQDIYAQLTGGSICLLYICIVLDLAVGVVVCNWHLCSIDCILVFKASMLNWLGGLDLPVGVSVCKASMLDWLGGPSAFYIYALY